MPKLFLPVSLVVLETQCHALAKMAIEDCLHHADFEQVLIFSNRDLRIPGTEFHQVPDWPTVDGLSRYLWFDIHPRIRTSHMFLLHWDSWIIDPEMWTPEFLDYDWVGAPWWYEDGMNVGCGAFCLRSKRLLEHLVANQEQYPHQTCDDDTICRKYRRSLEADGFRWPSDDLAFDLAFECTRPSGSRRHFGFHKIDNWPFVMHPRDLIERACIAADTPYLLRTGQINRLLTMAPWLAGELKQAPIRSAIHRPTPSARGKFLARPYDHDFPI